MYLAWSLISDWKPIIMFIVSKDLPDLHGSGRKVEKIMYFVNKYFEQPHETMMFGF